MATGKITINWTSYSPIFPDVVSLQLFDECKFSNQNLFIRSRFLFFQIFMTRLIIIFLALFLIFGDDNHLFPSAGWKFELLFIIEFPFIIIAFFVTINFLLSAISYCSSYFESIKYEKELSRILSKSISYNNFCIAMCDIDKRYIMQIQRMVVQK